MNYQWVDEYLTALPSVEKDFKQEWGWFRYMIGGKMFAAVCLDDDGTPKYLTFKLSPMEGQFLRDMYEDIIPGYYMNKTHWNSLIYGGQVPDELVKDVLKKSYDLVLSGFSKKKQTEILNTDFEKEI